MGWTKRNVVRIDKLTPAQEAKIIYFREKWKAIAASTEPFDIAAATEGIRRFTKENGAKSLGRVYTTNSPASGWKDGGFHWDFDSYKPYRSLEWSAWGMRCRITRTFLASVVQTVEQAYERNIPAALRLTELGPPREHWGHHYNQYGQCDARWLAVVDFFATVFDDQYCTKLYGLMEAVSAAGFIWLRPGRIIFCDRPEIAKYDDRGRPHCQDGAALKYRDGYTYYAIHGVPVPQKYIETPSDQLDLGELIKEPNAAVRMAVIEKFGFMRLLHTMKYKRVSTAGGNSLLDFTLQNPGFASNKLRVLHLKWRDKTGNRETVVPVPILPRQFGDDCPQDTDDCEQVRRWTLGWPKEALAVAET